MSKKFIYQVSFCLMSVYHLGTGIQNWFDLTPKDLFLIDGKPNDGTNGVAKLLHLIWSLWYTGAILGQIFAHFQGSAAAKQAAAVASIYYHAGATLGAILFFDKFQAFNPARVPTWALAVLHSVATVFFIAIFLCAEDTNASKDKRN